MKNFLTKLSDNTGSILIQVLIFSVLAVMISSFILAYILRTSNEQTNNAVRAMSELHLINVQGALSSRNILHNSVKNENLPTANGGLGLTPTLRNCTAQLASDLKISTDIVGATACIPVTNPATTNFLLYNDDGTPLYPNPKAANNACVLDNNACALNSAVCIPGKTVTPCECGSTVQCRWKIFFEYIVTPDHQGASITGSVVYVPGGAVPEIPIAPRKISVNVAIGTLITSDAHQTCKPGSENFIGLSSEGSPICSKTAGLTKSCPNGLYAYGLDPDGNFLCRPIGQ